MTIIIWTGEAYDRGYAWTTNLAKNLVFRTRPRNDITNRETQMLALGELIAEICATFEQPIGIELETDTPVPQAIIDEADSEYV